MICSIEYTAIFTNQQKTPQPTGLISIEANWICTSQNVLLLESYNLHIPMLASMTNQYLYKEEQQIEKGEFFINFSGNPGVFY